MVMYTVAEIEWKKCVRFSGNTEMRKSIESFYYAASELVIENVLFVTVPVQ